MYKCEEYLENVQNPTVRSNICKLRIGNNKLNYYIGIKFNLSKLCTLCDKNSDETVKRVLPYCHHYSEIRKTY